MCGRYTQTSKPEQIRQLSYAVDSMVNSPQVDSPECIAPRPSAPASLEFDFGGGL